ncbi:MAG: PEP-CTERM sorting domain-containing protein [Planctomycetota bacterium]|nr:MAG: PEP-CTERM sorting domain-containing protein [Planctomycetota bacterium]
MRRRSIMKKLLVLMLVLGVTSAANAAISFKIEGSDAPSSISVAQGATVTIQIYSTTTENYMVYVGMDISTMSAFGSPSGSHTYKGSDNGPDGGNAGETGAITAYFESGWLDGYEVRTQSTAGQVVAGIQHTVSFTAPMADGSTRVGMFRPPNYSWDADELDVLTINVPEPMTIGLLGLGGLFLLRRRK